MGKRKRIGEALVEKGAINEAQLERALRAHRILGGHLGTSLIELGYVDEETLGETLAETLNVRYASADHLKDIPQDVIDVLPLEIATKYRAIPMRVEDRTLHVAAIAASTLTALSSVTGYRIVPWVAPEIRIFQAMQTYYGIPLKPRYISLCHELDQRSAHQAEAPAPPQPVARDLPPREQAPAAPRGGSGFEVGSEFGYGKSWREIAGLDDRRSSARRRPAWKAETDDGPSVWKVNLAKEITRSMMASAEALMQLGFLRNERNLHTDFGECLAAHVLGLELYERSPEVGFEAQDSAGRTYRICTEVLAPGTEPRGVYLSDADRRFDSLVAVGLTEALEIRAMLRIPYQAVLEVGMVSRGGLELTWTACEADPRVECLYPFQQESEQTSESPEFDHV